MKPSEQVRGDPFVFAIAPTNAREPLGECLHRGLRLEPCERSTNTKVNTKAEGMMLNFLPTQVELIRVRVHRFVSVR